jgi:uncharacterized membrane protein YdbT with pleckstrin-like domain
MAFPRRLLVDDEQLVLDLRPHWIALVQPALVTLLVVAIWWLVAAKGGEGSVWTVVDWIVGIGGVLVLIVFCLRRVISWATSEFVVTSDRVIHRQGFIAKRSMEIPLEAINDVRFEQGMFERAIGAGSLVIESASEFGRNVFRDIRKPEEVQKTIYREGEHNQQRMRGALPPAAAPSTASELERLADLRDRGVLTPREFEEQKARILGQHPGAG